MTTIPLVVILGPTAVGKSEIATQLAERLHGEIVSADSRLFYRGMDIGTAKPGQKARSQVPHYLIDVANPDEIWSLGIFQKEAQRAIQSIVDHHHLPFLVGGTGQFVRSIIEGWSVPAVEPNPHLRHVLNNWALQVGPSELHHKLAVMDPQAALSIDPSNVRRTIRAMEVILSTGRKFSEMRSRQDSPYNYLLLGLFRPRAELYQRIDQRIDEMISAGFVDEVRGLLNKGYSPDLPTLSAIGYGEIVGYIQGKHSLEEAIKLMKRRTRIFVRRQANWFKSEDPDIHWFQINAGTLVEMEKTIRDWLHSEEKSDGK
jgi:tRNA dimethylallyltransferase